MYEHSEYEGQDCRLSRSKHVTSSEEADHETLELTIEDKAELSAMNLWNEKTISLIGGDIPRIESDNVTSFKEIRRINVGRYGAVTKI